MQNDHIVTFATYYDPMLAQIVRTRLEDNDIPCFIADENMIGINPLYNNALGGIKLKVFERDVERCKAILAEEPIETEQADTKATDELTCPYCHSNNVRYGDATEKKYGWFAILVSFLFFVLPFLSRKAWHCFNCGRDFE
jgi:ASC-1-like (ASCH) protein